MESLGLVLAGGGAKGAYHIGAWKAFREYGVEQNIGNISGTSVGALNAVLFALGDYDLAERIWLGLSYTKVLSIGYGKLLAMLSGLGIEMLDVATLGIMSGAGIFSRDGLCEIMDREIDFSVLKTTSKHVFAGAYNLSRLRMEYLEISHQSKERAKKILLASSALPVIYPQVSIDGSRYIDGGISNNVPIAPLYNQGCRNILVIHLGRDSIISSIKKFKDARILEIVPVKDQGNFADGTMDFSATGIRKRMNQGYDDTCNVLDPLYKMGIIQQRYGIILNNMIDNESLARRKLKQLDENNEKIKNNNIASRNNLMEVLKHE